MAQTRRPSPSRRGLRHHSARGQRLVDLAIESNTADGLRTIHAVALGYDEPGALCDAFDLDSCSVADAKAASKLIYDESQRLLVRDGFPEALMVHRSDPAGLRQGVLAVTMDRSTAESFRGDTMTFAVRRDQILTYARGLNPYDSYAGEGELHVEAKSLVPVRSASGTLYADDVDYGTVTERGRDARPSRARGDWGYYDREQSLRDAGMPGGQVFANVEAAQRYANTVLRQEGINIPVTIHYVDRQVGESYSQVAMDKSKGRIVLSKGMLQEDFLIHELAHIVHRMGGGKGASHGSDFAAVHARMMHEYMGVSLRLFGSAHVAGLNYDLYRGFVPLVPEEFTREATQENARKILDWLGARGLGMHWTPLLWVSEKWYRVYPPASTPGMAPVRVLVTARPAGRNITDFWETNVERLLAGGVQEPDIGEIGGLVSYGWEQEHPIKAGAEMVISEAKVSFPGLKDATVVLRGPLRLQASFAPPSAQSEFGDGVLEPSLQPDLSDGAYRAWEGWTESGRVWPTEYLREAMEEPFASNFQANLRRMGFPSTVTLRRNNGLPSPLPEIINASIQQEWGIGDPGEKTSINGQPLQPVEFEVPLSDIVAFGYTPEGEVFVRTRNLRVTKQALIHVASTGTYWRTHNKSRPFDLDNAYSIPLSDRGYYDDPKMSRHYRPGFSAMDDPWHLWFYVVAMGWHADKLIQNDWVIEFSGRPITEEDYAKATGITDQETRDWFFNKGRGHDDEWLILPDFRVVNKISWTEFERLLLRTPLPPNPQGEARYNSHFDTWQKVADVLVDRRAKGLDTGPVVDFVIDKFSKTRSGAWRPATSIPALYHGTPASLLPGDIISPAAARGEPSANAGSGASSTGAFATDSLTLARVFARGGNVYQVVPVDPSDVFVDLIDGYYEYASHSGFVVVGPVTPKMAAGAPSAGEGWTIDGQPYFTGQWIEVRGLHIFDDDGPFPCRRVVGPVDGGFGWEVYVPIGFGPNSGKRLSGTAKTLDAAKEKALAATRKDDEANGKYLERQRQLLGSMRSTSSAQKMAWGEDHAFTIVNNTDMSAQKFVRWLAPDFNSAWVQPDGIVTACYTHAHVGDVATLLDRGWVRMDVMPTAGTVFVQAVRPLTEDQIQSVRTCVLQSGASRMETSTGLGDSFNLREYPATSPSAVTSVLRDFTTISLTAMAAGPVVQLGPARLKYDYPGQVQRIGILDPEAEPPKPGWTYFTHEPVEDWRSRRKREEWEAGNGTTKRKPAPKWQEGSGTADEGTIAFLDYIERNDEVFIAYMSVRDDHRRQGLAKKLVDWVYDLARSKGKARVNWGQVFYPANQLYWQYADKDLGVQTTGKPLDGRMGAKNPNLDDEDGDYPWVGVMSPQEFCRKLNTDYVISAWVRPDGIIEGVMAHWDYSYHFGQGEVRLSLAAPEMNIETNRAITDEQIDALRIIFAQTKCDRLYIGNDPHFGVRLSQFDATLRDWNLNFPPEHTASKTATRFSPSQMASWESTRPWALSVDDAKAQMVDGWWYRTTRGSEVASWEGGYIRPSEDFFSLPEETKRAIAYHEAGHAMVEAAGGLRAVGDDPLAIMDLPGAQSLSYNAEEVLAEAYSVLWTEPEWFERMGAQKIRSMVVALAKEAGFPLPSNVKTARVSIPVKDVRPIPPDGFGSEGTVVRGTGYRVISGWQELITALNRRWYRSEGTYTVRGHEGETQFATELSEVLNWRGGGGRSDGFDPTAIIEVELDGLPFRSLSPAVKAEQRGGGVSTMPFDTGAGIGIVGPIPLDRIKNVHVLDNGRITETLRGDAWKMRASKESREMDWRGDMGEIYRGEAFIEWRSWRAWVCATKSGFQLHRFRNAGTGKSTACGKNGLNIEWDDAWFEPLIKVFPLGDEMASMRDWQSPRSEVVHPTTRKKLDKCPGCWDEFGKAMYDIAGFVHRTTRSLPKIDSPQFADALAKHDRDLAEKYRMIRDPDFKIRGSLHTAEATGDCYEAAGRFILDEVDQSVEDRFWLCHGLVVGTGASVKGVKFSHAWVEYTDPSGITMVIDNSNGLHYQGLRDRYYDIGSIDPKTVVRYSPTEARVQMLRHRHWGPWDPMFDHTATLHTAVTWPESYISHDDRADTTGYWYHGSPSKFPPGTILSGVGPRRGVPMWSETYEREPDRADWVWVTDSIDAARDWAAKQGWLDEDAVHVYRVEPMDGPVRPYYDHQHSDGYIVPRARVVTEVEIFPRGLPVGELDPFTAMAVPDFKGRTKNLSDRQVLAACERIMKDIAREFGYSGALPDVVISPDLPGGTDGRSIDPSREFPNGAILLNEEFWLPNARDKESGYDAFRILAHEAIHALVQRGEKSYPGFSQMITEGGAEVLAVYYWAKNAPTFDDRDAVRRDGKWVPGDIAMVARSNYGEWIVELMRRTASKVGWNREAIVREVQRVVAGDHNTKLAFRDGTNPDFQTPPGVKADHESLLLWLIEGVRKVSSYRAWTISEFPEPLNRMRKMQAFVDGEEIGFLVWASESHLMTKAGEVMFVWTHPQWRRKGVATSLWRHVKEIEPRLHHSDDLSTDGFAWSKAVGASKTASVPTTLYHLTDKVDFRLDPKKRPQNNTTLGGSLDPGIFLCRDVGSWAAGYGYWRPWVVEFSVPSDLDRLDGVIGGYAGEVYVPAAHYDKLRINRVIPLDAYDREEWGGWGSTEDYFETAFDTFEPIEVARSGPNMYPWRGYRYPGDARQTDSGWQEAYKKRVKDYQRKHPSVYGSRKTASAITFDQRPINDPFVDGHIRLSDDGLMYDAKIGDVVAGWMHLRRRLDDGVWEVYAIRVYPEYQRQGVATALLAKAREDLGRVDHAPPNYRSPDGLAWSEKVAKTASSNTIWRGYRIEFPKAMEDEIWRLMSGPTDESEIDQHYKVGPMILDYLTSHHWEDGVGLGRHWTTDRSVAESVQGRGLTVILESTYQPGDVSPELVHTNEWAAKTESEVNIKPGANLSITGLYLTDIATMLKGENLLNRTIRAQAKYVP